MRQEERWRLFVALVLPGEGQDLLDRWARQVGGGGVKRVARGNFHITLQFLGDVPVEGIPALERRLERVVRGIPPFEVVVEGVGGFPSPDAARVWFFTLREPPPELYRLAQGVRNELASLGYRDRKAFHPHITFARLKGRPRSVPSIKTGAYRWPVTEMVLMRSVLKPRGPVYTPLRRFPLRM